MNKLKASVLLFLAMALYGIVYALDIIHRHSMDTTWPLHARYHIVVSAIHIVAMSIVIGFIATTRLIKGSKSAWITLAIFSPLVWIAWPVARFAMGEPTPISIMLFIGEGFVVMIAALWLSYGPCYRDGKVE